MSKERFSSRVRFTSNYFKLVLCSWIVNPNLKHPSSIGWGKPTCTLVPWRQGFRHPTKNECMGLVRPNLIKTPKFLEYRITYYYITASWIIVSGDATSSLRARHLILFQRPRCQSRGKRERTRLCNPYLPVFAAGAAAMQLFVAMPPPSPSSVTDDRNRRCCRLNSHSYVLYPDSVAFSRIENDKV